MVFFVIFVYLLETTGHNMEKQTKPIKPVITQKGKSLKDYLIIKEWEAARERSIEREIYKYYKIKE